jgi:hypothetical protein
MTFEDDDAIAESIGRPGAARFLDPDDVSRR